MRHLQLLRDPRRAGPSAGARTALLLVVTMLGAGSATADIREALGNNPNFEAVMRLLDTSPTRCTQGADRRICTWLIEEASPARAELATPTAGPGPLQVVCDFDAVGPPRAGRRSTCSVHEPAVPRTRNRRQPWTLADPDEAALALQQARTLVQLSHTFASSPTHCVQRDDAEWVCAWEAQPRDPGHAMLGALAETSAAARLICRLPIESGERDEDSCRVQELD